MSKTHGTQKDEGRGLAGGGSHHQSLLHDSVTDTLRTSVFLSRLYKCMAG
jgi:hypothetical protein